jgi:hypothetical protein
MRKLYVFLLLVPLVFFLAGLAYSQSGSTGAIEGKVLDEEGSPLPGAEVKLSSPDLIGGTQIKQTTNEGKFRFVAVPRGTYVVEATLPGFIPARRENVKLFVRQTITVDLILKIGTLEEEVTVIGVSPLVDVKDTMINATNLDKQMLQTVGAEMRFKDPTNLLSFAPGVIDRSAMGAPENVSTQWQIDGQNLLTYIGAGSYWNAPDMNIIEEVQISGSGANAEYGGFTGAVMNMISKSGGNTFEGLVELSYSPLSWNWDNVDESKPKFSLWETRTSPRQRYYDAHFGLGGPVIRDKLWFYVSVGYVQGDWEARAPDTRSEQILKGFGKLTWQPNSNNRLTAWLEYEGWDWINVGLSTTRPVEATNLQTGPGVPAAMDWLHTFSEKTFTEIKVGYYYSYWDYRPNQGRDVPERYDFLTGTYSGNYGWYSDTESSHLTASASLTHHADEFLGGSHDFKAGVEFIGGHDNWDFGYPGGYTYYDNYPWSYYEYYENYYGYNWYKPTTFAYSYSYDLQTHGRSLAVFAQDSWKISDRLTINPGVRLMFNRGYLPNQQDEAFFKPKNALEFRLGFTFDVFGDHTTAIKAHYGRFHESFKTHYYYRAEPNKEDWVMYEVLEDGSFYEIFRQNYAISASIDPNISMPYSDQFTFGIERTLMKDTTLTLTFIHRIYKNFISMVDTGSRWELEPWTFTDENGQEQTMNIYRRDPAYAGEFTIANPKEGLSPAVIITPENKYTGFSISLNKRFSDGWMFHIDYTYSVAKGNHTNDYGSGSWGGYFYENPNRQINAYGPLAVDAPHVLHLYGTVELPLGFVLTPRFLLRSGSNWNRWRDTPAWAGRVPLRIEERGSRRRPTRTDLDLRLEKVFMLSGRMSVGVIFDAFNVFNSGVETGTISKITNVNFGKAGNINAPRYIRLGLRLIF